MRFKLFAVAFAVAASPAFAQEATTPDLTATGDAAAGEAAFRQCATCHAVVDADGNALAGRAQVRTGPNLYGVVGRVAGTYPEFRYSASMAAAGEKGLIWDEAQFVAYTQDPTPFLRAFLGEESARGNMTFKLRNPDDAKNLYAYLQSLAPAEAAPASN
jgi:cytochrome c